MDAARLADAITTGIQTGKFTTDRPLPSPKDFAKLHDVHPATVRKALATLVAQRTVERSGRAWKVSLPHSGKPARSPVLWCIGASDSEGNLRMDTDREWDFWREIQGEAIRNGMEPRLVPWSGALPGLDGVLGAVVSTWHMNDSTALLDSLLRTRLPATVWVANHENLPGQRYRHVNTMWFHDLAFGKESGHTMARHVAKLGHRKIAWISPFHASEWSRNRLAGLQEELPADIALFTANHEWVSEWDLQKDIYKDPQVLGRIDLAEVDHGGATEAIALPLVETITRERALEILGPRLDAALAFKATLWVAASDLTARWCLHWLRGRGIRTPQDLLLAGFDDSREASRLGLTSLRFDVQSMARAMLHQILSSRRQHRNLTRYAGHVVTRSSTSPSPRH
ncbi:MAG: hypothetical protein RL318_650 [Fibrobacterota bacterium]